MELQEAFLRLEESVHRFPRGYRELFVAPMQLKNSVTHYSRKV
jgi:hypothetical protein